MYNGLRKSISMHDTHKVFLWCITSINTVLGSFSKKSYLILDFLEIGHDVHTHTYVGIYLHANFTYGDYGETVYCISK